MVSRRGFSYSSFCASSSPEGSSVLSLSTIFILITSTSVSCLHFAQNSGYRTRTVSLRTLVSLCVPQMGQGRKRNFVSARISIFFSRKASFSHIYYPFSFCAFSKAFSNHGLGQVRSLRKINADSGSFSFTAK